MGEPDPGTRGDELSRRRERLDSWNTATADLEPPFATIDLEAFRKNATDLLHRAGRTPVRVASKSVRVRSLVEEAVREQGFRGVMAYSLAEAVWLVDNGLDDILMGYPSVDRAALRKVAADQRLADAITLMVDDVAQLDFIDTQVGVRQRAAQLRVCIDLDTAWRPFGLVVGARRSPVREPAQAVALGGEIERRPGYRLVGVMTYEAQIAGVPDLNAIVRWMKFRSALEIDGRRGRVLTALQEAGADLEFVNAGGTGSVETSAAGAGVTEVTAGSGLFGPQLFDGYRSFQPAPAAAFALPVVRRPGAKVVTAFGGGYVASGPAGASRLPRPYFPGPLGLSRTEGAGEVQTPVRGAAADQLVIGDRIWFRHPKAGEMCERFQVVHLLEGDRIVATVPTYRGEGRCFG